MLDYRSPDTEDPYDEEREARRHKVAEWVGVIFGETIAQIVIPIIVLMSVFYFAGKGCY